MPAAAPGPISGTPSRTWPTTWRVCSTHLISTAPIWWGCPVEPDAYDRQARAYLHFDVLDRLADISAPTLVIVGEQDLLTPPWVAREVADGIPGARFEIVPGDGTSHLVALERPAEFNQLVMDFLAP